MQLTKSLLVFALYMFGTQHVLAVPVNPEPDATSVENVALKTGSGDSQSDPIKADLEVKGQSALPFDVDCWAILCKGAPNVLQRVNEKTKNSNRDRSGANKGPFKDPQKWGIKALPPKNPSWSAQDFKSPEEYAFASSLQGGTNAILAPVNLASQNSQGGVLNGFYSANKVAQFDPSKPQQTKGTWFQITKFTGAAGPYCKALGSNDKSVCARNKNIAGDWGFDPAKWAYQYDEKNNKFNYVGK
ncbi:hypothetical protein F9C07_2284533 [Aspergillus flavus]|uniref:Deoxyribonuclease NucA/NucB domain-containing protein n=1 Tax=Aspergillus flavus (strain ATCC 200026 / FGSC A1120 / IAM 13836 / NRRL 3357 / JCM 12722 / SRRC 167) TaxID=332952 RepID=A0A7U2QTE0_ASPFN|nr:uncharacterized protein G4B84_007750 [Aspergillus flavus NRRL3357]KAF7617016.1 hypothetical protein AFLA_005066 [Aspergillus flavus NRRL3357]QMW32319.1 hypothetical protein G4B84_007750 [Aspergillus flavus NRRL3357]QRD83774.1 hypothetical protein F9C07_2284533 [Aspergillus flavus]